MSIVNFSVPDEATNEFNAVFSGRNKSAIIAGLMREGVAREKPADAVSDSKDRVAREFESATAPGVHESPRGLAVRLGRHLFDTRYHAVALHTPGATLVTADKRHFRSAKDLGHIALLADFVP